MELAIIKALRHVRSKMDAQFFDNLKRTISCLR